jgi:hypothetical protein
MLKRLVILCALAAVVATAPACIFDPEDGGGDHVVPPPQFKDLTKRENVITNVEAAYNARRLDKYDQALDVDFTFFLSTGDINNGLPNQWDRATEILYNSRLFDKNYATLPCQSIYMNIKTEDGITWTEIIPQSAPTEKWYSTQGIYYDFKFEISPNTYIPLAGSRAIFTVRNAGTDAEPHWQLVEFRDLGGAQ